MYFTDNGRDNMGGANDPAHYDKPPDELNFRPGNLTTHFGFPECWGGGQGAAQLIDHEFNANASCEPYTPALVNLEPHAAALGLTFSKDQVDSSWPAKFRNGIFIANHGSWDSVPPRGYRISFVNLDNLDLTEESFASGFVFGYDGMNVDAWGRLADVDFVEGSLLVSNDKRGEIYEIFYVDDGGISTALIGGLCGAALLIVCIGVVLYVLIERKQAERPKPYARI